MFLVNSIRERTRNYQVQLDGNIRGVLAVKEMTNTLLHWLPQKIIKSSRGPRFGLSVLGVQSVGAQGEKCSCLRVGPQIKM